MFLIIGLGNPGEEYELTRHNVGFVVVDAIAQQFNISWKHQKKLQSEIAKNPEMILAKPQTFMNLSGMALPAIIGNWKLKIENLIIIHDDIDLPFGTIRVSHNASSGGHNGVQSIIDHLRTKEFWRIRIGIHPNYKLQTTNYKLDTPEFVLKRFSAQEKKKFPALWDAIATLLEEFLQGKRKVQTIHL